MPKYYSFEKGKYGSATGTIVPFPKTLSGKDPSSSDWTTNVPAGYLRCDGSILQAESFRRLSEVIGIGDDCIYKKVGTTLDNVDENGEGGEIQLPDLGSKYITAFSSNTGLFLDDTSQNPNSTTQTEKVGIGVTLNLNGGNSVEVSYSGNLVLPPTSIPVSGNYAMAMDYLTQSSGHIEEQILAHGHFSNAARLVRSTARDEREFAIGAKCTPDDPVPGQFVNVVEFEDISVGITGSISDTQHFHSISRTNPTKNVTVNVPEVSTIPIETITTTVTLASENTTAFNDINQRFILVEYLIKY